MPVMRVTLKYKILIQLWNFTWSTLRDATGGAERLGPAAASFNHIIGAQQNRWRHLKAERPRGLEVDGQLESCRLHDRKVGRLLALQNAADVEPGLASRLEPVVRIAHQPASLDEVAIKIDRGNCVACRKRDKLAAPTVEVRIAVDEERTGPLPDKVREGRIDLGLSAGLEDDDRSPDAARCSLHVCQVIGTGIARIHENADGCG